jgi:hypothetical protein
MNLSKALEILIKDWENLHEEGGTELSVEEVLEMLDPGGKLADCSHLEPEQGAELIIGKLQQTPDKLQNAEVFMAQFDTPDELLDEFDLYDLIHDLAGPEDD